MKGITYAFKGGDAVVGEGDGVARYDAQRLSVPEELQAQRSVRHYAVLGFHLRVLHDAVLAKAAG